jgi:hypothetical protein
MEQGKKFGFRIEQFEGGSLILHLTLNDHDTGTYMLFFSYFDFVQSLHRTIDAWYLFGPLDSDDRDKIIANITSRIKSDAH